jgi:hypothetical protein
MKHPEKRRSRVTVSRRSSNVALSPYLVEDVAMTMGELMRARDGDTSVIVHP